jgi:transposase
MDRSFLETLSREELIELVLQLSSAVEALTRRVEELEGRSGPPPKAPAKTPDNSSVPPSQGRKASSDLPSPGKGRRRRKGRAGSHRMLSPQPTRTLSLKVECCPHCRGDVSQADQRLCERYDHVELPPIEPIVTRIELFGGNCPSCRSSFKAPAPADMAPGSPFGAGLRAFAIYLRYQHGIALKRLSDTFHDLFGLTISQGALVNMFKQASGAFRAQADRLRVDLLAHPALASDETGLRVGKRNFWLWVVQAKDTAVFQVDPTRSKRVLEDFLDGHRPDFWLSDRYGGQQGFAAKAHQFCLAHLIRDTQYVMDTGDDCFAPRLIDLFKRACRAGRKRDNLTDCQLAGFNRKYVKKLSELLDLNPANEEGVKFQRTIGKIRRHLFVFLTNRDVDATNNGCERSLRPCVTFRKITNGFRTEWGARLYADIRSTLETGRRRMFKPIDAIIHTLQNKPLRQAVA